MAITKDYIPSADVDFFNWEVNLINLVNTNAVAWAIPTGVGTSFVALTTEQGTYTPLYNKITNKNNRTKSDVTAHRQARIHFEKTLRQFVGEFLAKNSKVTNAQREQLEITVKDTTVSSRSAITTAPFAQISGQSGSRILVECRQQNDGSRTSKHPDSDAVEIIYSIGTTPPASTKDCNNTFVSSKARFFLELGNENVGKKCYAYVRWINTSDNSKSGPRNGMLTATITE